MLLRACRRSLSATAAARTSPLLPCRTSAHCLSCRRVSSTVQTAEQNPAAPTASTPSPWAAGAPPPRRFVRRWFLPGVDSPSFSLTSDGKKVPPTTSDTRDDATSKAPRRPTENQATTTGAPVAENATTSTEKVSHPTPARAARTTSGSGEGETIATSASHSHDGLAGSGESDEAFAENKVLREGLHSRNTHIKALLVAGLGSAFARAGIHNDGIRTSFSAVNTQSIKQLTGLKRIPPKLMLSCLTNEERSITWLDISAHPTATLTEYKESVQEILVGLGMHQSMINNSAEPVLLPQVTVSKDMRCLLMRYATEAPIDNTQDTFQDLTNRFTLFMTADSVVTVHRTQCTYVEELKVDWQRSIQGLDSPTAIMGSLLFYFVKETLGTFSTAISKCIVEFDRYESGLFVNHKNRSDLAREIYHIKRRASVYSRTLKLTQDAFSHMAAALHVDVTNVQYQEVQHSLSHVESIAEELNANADSVLQLLFQLSSYQVNELMRVLTLFSAFFIPLSFISSAYGMNFDNLPLLHSPHGELYCGGLMLMVGTIIYFWFKSKHFI